MALAYGLIALLPSSDDAGVIRGRVVNMSQHEAPCAGAEVILRARIDGEFAAVANTVTDAAGNYRFEGLPVGPEYLYLPGANHAEIHYPGRRVGLTRGQPAAFVTLEVRDTVAEPSPLLIRQHEIALETEPGAVHVVEAMLVDNPTATTYVGRAPTEGMPPVTLRLNVPADFERITFEREKFGSRFQVIDGKLVTGIPWTPGAQWLRFTYTLPAAALRGTWQRVLDAPCESIRVRVKHTRAEEIACDLPPAADGPSNERTFQSGDGVLPAGHVFRVQLGNVALPWTFYARWAALFALAGLIVATALILWRPRRHAAAVTDDSAIGQEPLLPPVSSEAPKSRSPRRQQHGRAA
jgi:hypothetical protein